MVGPEAGAVGGFEGALRWGEGGADGVVDEVKAAGCGVGLAEAGGVEGLDCGYAGREKCQ